MSTTTRRAILARTALAASLALSLSSVCLSSANAISLEGSFATNYSFSVFSGAASVPLSYGGIVFKAGDPNKVLIGGAANGLAGAIYEAPVVRDSNGHVTGIGAGVKVADAPYIDGGLAYGPNNTLFFTQYPIHGIGQIKPGSTAPDTTTVPFPGIASSLGALNFIPSGFTNAGDMIVVSYNTGQVGRVEISPDGTGTYTFGPVLDLQEGADALPGGPEGIIHIKAGNADFLTDSVLVAEWGAGNIAAYEIDPTTGMPIVATRRLFMSGVSGAEGAAIDPLTGDFVFSTFAGLNQFVVVQGFIAPPPVNGTPLPAAAALFPAGLGLFAYMSRRRKKASA